MDKKRIKILLVEDLSSDAALAQREILKVLPGAVFELVDNREAFISALDAFQPDLIVSDYQMPTFDGMSALKISLGKTPVTPFIIHTGSMNEDTAVDCMKAGATDYVIKEHIKRLGPAVLSALKNKAINIAATKAQNALVESESRFRRLAENADDLIYRFEFLPERKFAYVNPSAERITGYTPEEHYADPDLGFKLVHPDDRKLLEELAQGITDGPVSHTIRWKKKDGTVIWTEQKNVPIFNKKRQLIAFEGIARDITERKNNETIMLRNEKLLRIAGKLARLGGWLVDMEANKVIWSDEVAEIHEMPPGYSPSVEEGINFYAPESIERIQEIYTDCATKGIPYDEELQIITGTGKRLWVRTIGMAETNKSGKITGVQGAFQDITERKLAEVELKTAKEKAEESDRLKSAFLANMSHEIRTPMNGILGFAQLLKLPGLTGDQQQNYIRIIENSGNRMLHTISDLVEISKIESGHMEVNYSRIDVNEQMNHLIELFAPIISERKNNIRMKLSLPTQNIYIETDQDKLLAILSNLVNNAIKFSEKGVIELGYAQKGSHLEFHVRDEGIGIPREKIDAIFQRFVQVDTSLHSPYEGAGLGLSIAKAYVEALGGNMWVESEPDEGSTFYFTIPIAAQSIVPKTAQSNDHLKPKPISHATPREQIQGTWKVLVAEDDESSYELICTILEMHVSECLLATTGREAVDMLRSDPDIDLVLMDIKMPDMDGYEATRRIREFNKDIVVIAQTAYAMKGDREKALAAGCNDHITKPIRQRDLMAVISRNLKNFS